jgi:hypothetical protein
MERSKNKNNKLHHFNIISIKNFKLNILGKILILSELVINYKIIYQIILSLGKITNVKTK